MGLEVGPCFSAEGLLSHFSTDSTKIYTFVMMILPMLILCVFFLGVPCASSIALYLEIKLKMFSMEL